MSELDYDALRKVAEAATPGEMYHDGATAVAFRRTFDPPTVLRLLDLAQRAEAAEAALERVRALAERWRDDEGRGWISSCGEDLLETLHPARALDPKEPQ